MIKVKNNVREELTVDKLNDYLSEEKDPWLFTGDVTVEIMDSEGRIRNVIPTSAVWFDSERNRLVITAHSDKMPMQ